MIEYDLESYRRKFNGTKFVYFDMDSGQTKQGWAADIQTNDNNHIVIRCAGEEWRTATGEERQIEVMYHPIYTGIYMTNAKGVFGYVSRKHLKSFQVGLGSAFNVTGYHRGNIDASLNHSQVDLLAPVPERVYDKSAAGFLNKLFWWLEDKLFYKGYQIGYIKNDSTVLISRPEYEHPVKRAWKTPCQTPVLLNTSE